MWQAKGWSYQGYKTREELTDAQCRLFSRLQALQRGGLSAAVYTQTTDVETELNGLMTYDREVVKPFSKKFRNVIDSLLGR